MITSDGWADWAIREPGIADKVYTAINSASGVIPHSIVGSYEGAKSRLFSKQRDANGQYASYAAASWNFTNRKNGQMVQHYSIWSSCWTSGARYPNTNFVSVETEGGPPGNESEPLTLAQSHNLARLIHEVSGLQGWKPKRPTSTSDISATLWEHNEMTRFGALYTACPSGRIDWIDTLSRVHAMRVPTPVIEMRLEEMQSILFRQTGLFGENEIWFYNATISTPEVAVYDIYRESILQPGATAMSLNNDGSIATGQSAFVASKKIGNQAVRIIR